MGLYHSMAGEPRWDALRERQFIPYPKEHAPRVDHSKSPWCHRRMKPSLRLVALLAAAVTARAETLLVPSLAGDWQPLAASPLKTLPASPQGEQVAEPEAGQFYLFFEKPATPPKPGAKTPAKPAPRFTRIYQSADRNDFGVSGNYGDALHLVGTLPVVDAKVVKRDGRWFVAGHAPDSAEVRVAALDWKPIVTPTTAKTHPAKINVRVALYDDSGSAGKGIPSVSEQLGRCPDIEVTKLDAEGIRAGLTGYDVVIFTGGSGSKQANTIGLLGREQVRRFVEIGGGYIGICAGAYLACEGYSWGVKVLDAKTPSPKWERGAATLEIEATPDGQKTLGLPAKSAVIYHNGPVLTPANNPTIPDYEPLVFFRTETAKNGTPVGLQINTPAMARGAYGNGRVIACSPHPEQTEGLEKWIEHAVRAVAPSGKTTASR